MANSSSKYLGGTNLRGTVNDRDQATIEKILSYARRVAVVGLSDDPSRPSNSVAETLISHGYEVIPVNPEVDEVFGRHSYNSLSEVPGPIDVVDVFRRTRHLKDVAQDAVSSGARAIWMQSGLYSAEARAVGEDAGLDVVEDRCMAVEVNRYARKMKLPPDGS